MSVCTLVVGIGLPAAAAQQEDDRTAGAKPLKRLGQLDPNGATGSGGSASDDAGVATVVERAAGGDWTGQSARLRRSYLRLHAKAERAGEEPGRNIAEQGVQDGSGVRPARDAELRRSIEVLRRALDAGSGAGGGSVAGPELQAIAACESGGNPSAISADGTYRGKYQFSRETWASVGGTGDPAAAPEAEQDRRAAMLLASGGPGHWPVCG